MTSIRIASEPVAIRLDLGDAVSAREADLYELCARNPELRIERTAEGDVVVMTPSGGASSHRVLQIAIALGTWARDDGTGVAFDASAGFLLANGAMRGPDVSWLRRSRLEEVPAEERERFLPLCPDFVVEVKSPSDRLGDLQAKMEEYRAQGASLGWLVDPERRRVHVYRPDRDIEILQDPLEIEADPELPGFVLDLATVWEGL